MFLSRSTDVLSATCTCVICKISKVKVLIVQQKAISVIVYLYYWNIVTNALTYELCFNVVC